MKIGQMSIARVSPKADYLQLDICGHTPKEALQRYKTYQTDIPVVLHGDWTKKGFSENNIEERVKDYVETIQLLQAETTVLGFTMHPTFRKKVSFDTFLSCCERITKETEVEVWIENRSNSKIWLSLPDEIIEFSRQHVMCIDIAQLYISCGYSEETLFHTLSQLNWENIRELHVSNVKRTETHTFVARKVTDGNVNLLFLLPLMKNAPHWTLEILGGVATFEEQVQWIEERSLS